VTAGRGLITQISIVASRACCVLLPVPNLMAVLTVARSCHWYAPYAVAFLLPQ
jgi:hypothetical protein